MKFKEINSAEHFAERLFTHLRKCGVPEDIALERAYRYYGIGCDSIH